MGQRPQQHGRAWRALAVDGKTVRGTRHASSDGQAVHLLAVADQQAGAVLGQVGVDGKTNEITRFIPLLELGGYPSIAAACRHHARDATRTLGHPRTHPGMTTGHHALIFISVTAACRPRSTALPRSTGRCRPSHWRPQETSRWRCRRPGWALSTAGGRWRQSSRWP